MATIPIVQGHPTLVNWAKAFDPQGKPYRTAMLLNQSNELLTYMTWKMGNLDTGHKDAVDVGLPTASLGRFYRGYAPTKGDTAIIEDVCAMQGIRSEVDARLARLGGNETAYRASRSIKYMEAMYQLTAQQFMYGDTTLNKDGILGFSPRYNHIANVGNATYNTAANIIDSGGTGSNNTSVWLVVWGDETVTGIFPKASQAGITHQDLGEYDAFDPEQNRYRALGELWEWNYGLHIKDWRYVVRIANVNSADLASRANTQANGAPTQLIYTMADAMARIPSMGMGTATFLASRSVKAKLSQMAMDKSQNAISFKDATNQFGTVAPGSVGGVGQTPGLKGGTLHFLDVPVLTVDAIVPNEARVV